jgi:hypothetical protein
MSDTTVRDETRDAQEIAAFVGKGLTPEQVATKVDLPLAYVTSLTGHPAFRPALEKIGGKAALDQWDEFQNEKAAKATLRALVRERLSDYFKVLDAIAMDPDAKQEVRSNTVRFLLTESGITKEEAPPPATQELPPSFFVAVNEAAEEMDKPVVQHNDRSV